MTALALLSLFGIMIALAAIPSASVALVISRSATHGFSNGVAVSAGIVLGDLIFVALAILGMSFLAETLGSFFMILRYLGGAYLIWVGISLIRARGETTLATNDAARGTLAQSFAAGLLLTMGDIKAILFYASLFPAFVDMGQLTTSDIALICLITIVAVGGVKVLYALVAKRVAARFAGARAQRSGRVIVGTALTGAGVCLIAKS